MGKLAKWYDLKEIGDEHGALCIAEASRDIPFEVKRVYFIYDTAEGVARGFHAHYKTKQVLIAIAGSCKVKLDDGVVEEHVTMSKRSQALDMPPMLWHEMYDFSPDCVLLCLADDYYDEGDYIRCYDEFIEVVEKNKS